MNGGPSPRYVAEHFLFPRFLAERGISAVLAAIEQRNADFFIPVWMEAGFRFTPMMMSHVIGAYRVGVLTFPAPRTETEGYLGVVLGRSDQPAYSRYFVWEKSLNIMTGEATTVIGQWQEQTHYNHGAGPPFTGNLDNDARAFVDAVIAVADRG